MGDWQNATGEIELINNASFDYGGFGFLEDGAVDVLSRTLKEVPHMEACGTELIDRASEVDGAAFLGFKFASFASSGYTMNLIAFPALANAVTARGKKPVFIMDDSNHNSMFVGSWISKNTTVVRFRHNDLIDLEAKLKDFQGETDHELIVALEGNYSMEGGLPPLPGMISLKKSYKFSLYIDEAHSFLAIGSSGRGIVQHYQDLGHAISSTDVECIGATLSKSAGTVGGIIVSHDPVLAESIKSRLDEWHQTGGRGRLPTVVKMRLMQIWKKSGMVSQRMDRLRQHTVYILEGLHKAGLCVHSDYLSPVIVIITISVSSCARFCAECGRLGLACTAAGPPATAAWRSVGRLCINALLSKEDVENVVRIAVQAAINVGVTSKEANERIKNLKYDFREVDENDSKVASQNAIADRELDALLQQQIVSNHKRQIVNPLASELLNYGDEVLRSQGVGSSSVRLYWGTQLSHLKLEERLTQMHGSLKKALGNVHALVMTDGRNATTSTLAACIAPPASKSVMNLVLIPSAPCAMMTEAMMSMKRSKQVAIERYDSFSAIGEIIRSHAHKKKYLTLYLRSRNAEQELVDLSVALSQVRQRGVVGIQVLLDDSETFGKLGSRSLGYLNHLEDVHGTGYLKEVLDSTELPTRFFHIGSFEEAFRLQGGFVITEKTAAKVLHWTSRAFMFSTAPLPCNVAMIDRTIEALQAGSKFADVPVSIDEESVVEALGVSLRAA